MLNIDSRLINNFIISLQLLSLQLLFMVFEPRLLRLPLDVLDVLHDVLGLLVHDLQSPDLSLALLLPQNVEDLLLERFDFRLPPVKTLPSDAQAEQLLLRLPDHLLELPHLALQTDRQANPLVPFPCRSPHSVNVPLCLVRYFQVDNHLDVVDVQSSGCQVSSQKEVEVPLLELLERLDSLVLRQVPMQLRRLDAQQS